MVTFGCQSKSLRHVLFVATAISCSSPLSAALQKQQLTSSTTDSSSVPSKVISSIKTVFNALANASYASQGLIIVIPGTSQELVWKFGFGGSGDLLSPFGATEINLQNNPYAQSQQKTFSTLELGKLLIQDELLRRGKKLELLKWLSNRKVTPHALFAAKLLLLIKDLYTNRDVQFFRNQLLRLLIKLSLTDQSKLIDTTKPLSEHLPEVIKEWLIELCPDIINLIDTLWLTMLEQNPSSTAIDVQKLPKTVLAYAFKDVAAANNFHTWSQAYTGETFEEDAANTLSSQELNAIEWETFKTFKKSELQTHLQQLVPSTPSTSFFNTYNPVAKMVCINVCKINKPLDFIPAELYKALADTNKGPATVLCKAANGDVWVARTDDHLDFIDSVKLIAQTCIRTFKEYAAARAAFFKQNPTKAQAYKQAWEEREKCRKLVNMFLTTNDGKASLARLDNAMKKIIDTKNSTLQENKQAETKAKLENELATLRKNIETLQQRLNLYQGLEIDPSDKKTKIAKIESELSAAQEAIQKKEAEINACNEQKAIPTTTKEYKEEDSTQALQELISTAEKFKQQGEEVPQEIAKKIAELSQQTSSTSQSTIVTSPELYLAQRVQVARAYQDEADIIKADLEHRAKELDVIADEQKKKNKLIVFNNYEKRCYQAYELTLRNQAEKIEADNKKAHTLLSLRNALIQTPQALEDKEFAAEVRTLEAEVGLLIDRQPSLDQASSQLTNTTTTELQELMVNLSGNTEQYAKIKENLINNLTIIMQKSRHIRNYVNLYRYAIETSFPDVLPIFDQVMTTSRPMSFFGEI